MDQTPPPHHPTPCAATQMLEELRVPVTVILDSGVGYAMERWVVVPILFFDQLQS